MSDSTTATGMTRARVTSDVRESGSRSDGIAVAWTGRPAARTGSASRPRRPPRKRNAVYGSVARRASATARSGLTCPTVPPPTRSTRQLRARPGPGSTNVEEDTDGDEPNAQRAAAVGDEGQRDPRHRHEARDDGHVHPGLECEPHGDTGREERAGRVLGRQGDAHAAERDDQGEQPHRERTGEAELVAEDREDRVGVGMRQITELLAAGSETLANRAAERGRIQRLDRLDARAPGVGPGVDEREQTLVPLRVDDGERKHGDTGEDAEGDEDLQARARREVDRQRDDDDHDRGAEVGLGHDEAEHQHRDQNERHGDAPRADVVTPRAEPRRQIHDERELGELRGLQPDEPAESKPPRGATGGHADTGDQDRDEQRDREQKQGYSEQAQPVVVDARGDQHRRDAERRPGGLLCQEHAGVLVRVERGDPAGAIHHREPEEEEREHDEHERQVVGGGPREELHRATGVANAFTRALKRSPRSSADENMSNEAHAGESRTTSPGCARSRAAVTASSNALARRTGSFPAPAIACSISPAARPMSTAPLARTTSARASAPKSAFFETPPRMTTTGRSG